QDRRLDLRRRHFIAADTDQLAGAAEDPQPAIPAFDAIAGAVPVISIRGAVLPQVSQETVRAAHPQHPIPHLGLHALAAQADPQAVIALGGGSRRAQFGGAVFLANAAVREAVIHA